MKKLLALLFIASTMLISCEQNGVNESDNPKDAPSFTFTDGTEVNPTIGYEGGELAFSFISNCSWFVEENDDWINISPTSGNQGNHTLAISVAKNTTGEERLSKITILYGVDSQVVINLTQEANEVFETDSEGNYIVEADGGTVAVKVTTNLEYDVVIEEDAQSWLSVADTRAVREVTLIFTVAENESFDERSATVELKGADGKVLQSVSFKQKGVEEVFDTDSEGNYIVEADGGTVAVKVTTNLEYDVVIDEDAQSWLSVADTRAVREETLTLNVAKNEGSEERSATVNLCAKGGDILQTITIKQSCADNEIIYTTKYGYPIELNTTDGFGGNIMSHNYANGYGRIIFDNDVVSIPNEAFKDCTTLTTIVLPNSLSTIDSSAFSGCTSLTSITIPDSVTSIGSSAFYGCTSLTSINIPDSVTSIGSMAFSGCTGELIVNCNIPSATASRNSAFYKADFTKVTIGEGVTSIGDRAFYLCDSLKSVTIPDSVTTIGSSAFYDCTSLTSINIPDSVTSIGSMAFSGCTSLTSINIPDSVTTIGSSAFYDCTSLTSINIPDSVTTIGSSAFYDCTSLTSINIPDSVTTIGSSAFYDCTSLTSINIPDSVTSIGNYAFSGCVGLESLTIGKNVKEIGRDVFYDCRGELFVNCNIPGTDYGQFWEEGIFYGSRFDKITFGDNVTSIGDYAFRFYERSTPIIVIGKGVKEIGSDAFRQCQGELIVNCSNIPEHAFECSSFSTVTINDSVITIGDYAFEFCDMTSITIPFGVTKIGNRAFQNCTNLTTVTISDSVTSIGDYAFSGCDSLKDVYCKPTTPPMGGDWMFPPNNALYLRIYVPSNSVSAYKSASYWWDYKKHIFAYDFE